MSYCTEALALRADYSRSKMVTKTYFEWLWCWIIPSLGAWGGALNRICKEQWGTAQPRAPGMWDCCSGISVLPCRTCCCSNLETQQWNGAQVLQACLDTCTEPLQIPQSFIFSIFSVNALLVHARPWAGFQCFHPEPMSTSWSSFLVSKISPTLPRVPFPMGSEV